MLEATGRPLSAWQGAKQPPLLPLAEAFPIAINLDRDELYRRCDTRFDAMIAAGAVEEANAINALGLDPALPAMRAVGLPPLLAYLRGELSMQEACAAAKTATRNYAKRQITWLRGNFMSWNEYSSQALERTKQEVEIFSRNRLTSSF